MFVPEVAQKFRANAWLGAGLKFVIHIREKQDHKTTGQQDYNEKTRTALEPPEIRGQPPSRKATASQGGRRSENDEARMTNDE
jgi:hypothetical protein